MLTPVPMQRVELSLLKDDAAEAALLLANLTCFNPEIHEAPEAEVPELPGEPYRAAYAEGRTHLDKVLAHFELGFEAIAGARPGPVQLTELTALNAWLKETWAACSEQEERMRVLREDHRHTRQLLAVLGQFMDVHIDLTQLQKQSRVMNLHVGTVPRDNAERLEESIGLAGHVAIRFFSGLEQVNMIIAGPRGRAREVERVLQVAGWRAMEIPAEFHGLPEDVRANLGARLASLEAQQAREDAARIAAPGKDGLQERLLDAAHTLARAAPYADLAALMRGRGELATVSGWVPKARVPDLSRALQGALPARFALIARDPRPAERAQVPSLSSHPAWLRPVARRVQNYGVPRYGEIDPTILFAITSPLMFGMMFGDVDQGAVIALAGLLLRRARSPLTQYSTLVIAAGVSSAFFGLLYGSMFGFEHVLPALWMPPLSDPMRMLGAALGWGIGFIVLAGALTLRNRLAEGRIEEALFEAHGAAGLLLYLGLVYCAWRYATAGAVSAWAIAVVLAALAALLLHGWARSRGAPGWERAIIALMEAYEAILSDISNTLSFLRLAAFSLNHVALTLAILAVGGMMHRTGYWVSLVLGNVLMLVLEGAIVAIQTVRLEYYEGFSRFFGGDGRPFRPLVVGGLDQANTKPV